MTSIRVFGGRAGSQRSRSMATASCRARYAGPGTQCGDRFLTEIPSGLVPESDSILLHRGHECGRVAGQSRSVLLLLLGQVSAGSKHSDNGGNARISSAGFDWRIARNGLLIGLTCELGVAHEGAAERLIFVRLRRERVKPLRDIALLQGLLKAGAHVGLRAGNGVDFVQLRRVGVAVGECGGIFQPRLNDRLALLPALQEQVGFQSVRGRLRNRIADILLRLAVDA